MSKRLFRKSIFLDLCSMLLPLTRLTVIHDICIRCISLTLNEWLKISLQSVEVSRLHLFVLQQSSIDRNIKMTMCNVATTDMQIILSADNRYHIGTKHTNTAVYMHRFHRLAPCSEVIAS